jgi:hypothetical protein
LFENYDLKVLECEEKIKSDKETFLAMKERDISEQLKRLEAKQSELDVREERLREGE